MKTRRNGSPEPCGRTRFRSSPRVAGRVAWRNSAIVILLVTGCAVRHSAQPTLPATIQTSAAFPSSSIAGSTDETALMGTTVPIPTTTMLTASSGPRLIHFDDALLGTISDARPAFLLDPSIESLRSGSELTIGAALSGSTFGVQLDDQDLLVEPGKGDVGRILVKFPSALSEGVHWAAIQAKTPNGPRSVVGHVLQGSAALVQASAPKQLPSAVLAGDVSVFLPREPPQGYFDDLFDLIDGEDGIGIYSRVTRVARYVRSDGLLLPGPQELPVDFTPLGYSHGSVVGFRSDGTTWVIGPDGVESSSPTPVINLAMQRFASMLGAGQTYDFATARQLLRSPYDGLWYQRDYPSAALRLSMQSSHVFLPAGSGGVVEFQRPDGIARRVEIPNEKRLAVLDRACSPTAPGHCVALVQGVAPTLTAVGISPDGHLGFLGTVAAVPTLLLGRRYIAFMGGRAVAVVPSDDHVLITKLE
jgi:hypothetical protein